MFGMRMRTLDSVSLAKFCIKNVYGDSPYAYCNEITKRYYSCLGMNSKAIHIGLGLLSHIEAVYSADVTV